jgi:hypothetical protein
VHGIARHAVTADQVKSIKVPVEILVGDRNPAIAGTSIGANPFKPIGSSSWSRMPAISTASSNRSSSRAYLNWIDKNVLHAP